MVSRVWYFAIRDLTATVISIIDGAGPQEPAPFSFEDAGVKMQVDDNAALLSTPHSPLPTPHFTHEAPMSLTLEQAQKIVHVALAQAVVVLDERAAMRAVAAEDNSSVGRAKVAFGKANGCVMMGLGSRALQHRAKDNPQFMVAADNLFGGLIAVPGGVLIKDAAGTIAGAVGISGDTSDNDEACAMAGIAAAGLKGDSGA